MQPAQLIGKATSVVKLCARRCSRQIPRQAAQRQHKVPRTFTNSTRPLAASRLSTGRALRSRSSTSRTARSTACAQEAGSRATSLRGSKGMAAHPCHLVSSPLIHLFVPPVDLLVALAARFAGLSRPKPLGGASHKEHGAPRALRGRRTGKHRCCEIRRKSGSIERWITSGMLRPLLGRSGRQVSKKGGQTFFPESMCLILLLNHIVDLDGGGCCTLGSTGDLDF